MLDHCSMHIIDAYLSLVKAEVGNFYKNIF